jgi:hypothetical protein
VTTGLDFELPDCARGLPLCFARIRAARKSEKRFFEMSLVSLIRRNPSTMGVERGNLRIL